MRCSTWRLWDKDLEVELLGIELRAPGLHKLRKASE